MAIFSVGLTYYMYCVATPLTAGDVGKFIHITSGTGWVPGWYRCVAYFGPFGTADGTQNLMFMSHFATAITYPAGAVGALGGGTGTLELSSARPASDHYFYVTGNSYWDTTNGVGSACRYLFSKLGSTYNVDSKAVSGSTILQNGMQAMVSTHIADLNAAGVNSGGIKWHLAFEATNSLDSSADYSAATTYKQLNTYLYDIKNGTDSTYAVRKIIATASVRQNASTRANYAAKMAEYNNLLRRDYNVPTTSPYIFLPRAGLAAELTALAASEGGGVRYAPAEYMWDLQATPEFIVMNSDFYLADFIHLSTKGHQRAADFVASVITATTPSTPTWYRRNRSRGARF